KLDFAAFPGRQKIHGTLKYVHFGPSAILQTHGVKRRSDLETDRPLRYNPCQSRHSSRSPCARFHWYLGCDSNMSILSAVDIEEFWDDLLAFIEDRSVIPVVGAELLTVEENGKTIPLYRAVAERLLSKYGLSADALPQGAVLRQHHELSDAVSIVAASGRRVRDLYRPICDILTKLVASQKAPEPLR